MYVATALGCLQVRGKAANVDLYSLFSTGIHAPLNYITDPFLILYLF